MALERPLASVARDYGENANLNHFIFPFSA